MNGSAHVRDQANVRQGQNEMIVHYGLDWVQAEKH